MTTSPPDPLQLRQVMGAFATGVTIVTTVDAQGRDHGLTANSFCSVSLDPPLVLWNQSLAAPSHPAFRAAPCFAIHILGEEQIALSRRFAGAVADKFAGLELQRGLGGVPLLTGCTAVIECSAEARFPGGDHAVFVGRVQRAIRHGGAPLVFAGGRYLAARPHDGEGGLQRAAARAAGALATAAMPAATLAALHA